MYADTSDEIYRYGGRVPRNNPSKAAVAAMKKAYVAAFGSDTPADPDFRERYWFTDSFSGDVRSFNTLADAEAAGREALRAAEEERA